MKSTLSLCLKFLCVAVLFSSCASSYNHIKPEQLNFMNERTTDSVSLAYKYDLLNKKYEKKEKKKDVRLVALKIENKSDQTVTLGENAFLTYINDSPVNTLEKEKVFDKLKQQGAWYLFYLALTPVNLYTYETNSAGVQETTSTIPVGLILGPGLTATNMIVSGTANGKFKDDLEKYDLIGKPIAPGETVYGLIGISSDSYNALKLDVRM